MFSPGPQVTKCLLNRLVSADILYLQNTQKNLAYGFLKSVQVTFQLKHRG